MPEPSTAGALPKEAELSTRFRSSEWLFDFGFAYPLLPGFMLIEGLARCGFYGYTVMLTQHGYAYTNRTHFASLSAFWSYHHLYPVVFESISSCAFSRHTEPYHSERSISHHRRLKQPNRLTAIGPTVIPNQPTNITSCRIRLIQPNLPTQSRSINSNNG